MICTAFSIRQPWAWAILHAGKDIENRTWKLPRQYIRKPVLIHVGKKVEQEDVIHLLHLGYKVPELMDTGGIVGVTQFIGSNSPSKSQWAVSDQYNWRIDTARTKPLPFFPCSGRLSFFRVDYPFVEAYHASAR